ncbi:hypothetical protein ALC56_06048 [Trachymyrmex septentrionalis]|uniref:Uncharacterized protein n=1 Tax=Trachymyrmex septentrionalis TaxID=34720 RepID=A0A195FHT5_9HYME|nr:hypothetical protein ALC56_06048 [Trachymyrmex septentrionalis]
MLPISFLETYFKQNEQISRDQENRQGHDRNTKPSRGNLYPILNFHRTTQDNLETRALPDLRQFISPKLVIHLLKMQEKIFFTLDPLANENVLYLSFDLSVPSGFISDLSTCAISILSDRRVENVALPLYGNYNVQLA